MSINFRSTEPKYGLRGLGLTHAEALRTRIQRDHAAFAETEPVHVHPGRLPAAETKQHRNIQCRGDGRIPEDILGG